jgi:alpha-glucosidase
MMLLLTLRGTPTLYYGDEIGIGHVDITSDRIRDPWAKREPGLGIGRDPSRTPMQWDGSAFAGFSTHEPWLPLTSDYQARNVAAMSIDETSILFLVRSLLHYRCQHTSLSQGEWRLLSGKSSILAYQRHHGDNRIIVVLYYTADQQAWFVNTATKVRVAISTHGDRRGELVLSTLRLRANEGLLLEPA